MTLSFLLCQLMMHNSLLEQPMTIFTNILKNIDVYSGQSHFYTSILCVHQMVECWQGVHSYKKNIPPIQTESITEGLWIAICTSSSLSVPSHWLPLQPQAHFLSFPACSVPGDCLLQTVSPGPWLLIGVGQWEVPARDQRMGGEKWWYFFLTLFLFSCGVSGSCSTLPRQ